MAEYRGRIAPSPTGWLHLGHARTFWVAHERARRQHGRMIFRLEDLDARRCREEFAAGSREDLRWLGLDWEEGPDKGGPHAPYVQSARLNLYARMLAQLQASGAVYPCSCSRQDVARALHAPHAGEEEPVYPGTCRPGSEAKTERTRGGPCSWRFRVPDGEVVSFIDGALGKQEWVAGRDFGDFVVWRFDDVPSYQLAVVADDAEMGITEVVRGADLALSTARQILLYRALGRPLPRFFHCPLLTDAAGRRLAKRHDALGLRALRQAGADPEVWKREWEPLVGRIMKDERRGGAQNHWDG